MFHSEYLNEYVQYSMEPTGGTYGYHVLSAISTAAAMLGNRIKFKFGHKDIFPNTWVFLIGRSRYSMKSTIMGVSFKLIHDVFPVAILPDEITPQALIDAIGEQSSGHLFWSEAATYFEAADRQYMSNYLKLLTHFYDVPPEYTKRLRSMTNTEKVKNPCVSMEAASTPEWMGDIFKGENNFAGGYFQRCLWVAEDLNTSPNRNPSTPDNDLYVSLKKRLRVISNITTTGAGEPRLVGMSSDAVSVLSSYRENILKTYNPSTEFLSFKIQLATDMIKMSMILCALEDPSGLRIMRNHVEDAIDIANICLDSMPKVLRVGFSPYEKAVIKIMKILETNGHNTHKSDLIRRCGAEAGALNRILVSMKEARQIDCIDTQDGEFWFIVA